MLERSEIKTAIDIVDQWEDDQAGQVAAILMRCGNEIAQLRSRVADLERMQYDLIRSGALVAIEKCKNASGQRRAIDLYVSANQIAEDIVNATISKWWGSGMAALYEYQQLKPGAKEEAEAWAKMKKP